MKSHYLTCNKSIDDDLLDSIVNITKLEKDEVISLMSVLEEASLKSKPTRKEQVTHIIKDKSISAEEAISTVRSLLSLASIIDRDKDNISLILDDLISLNKIEETQKEAFLLQYKLIEDKFYSFFKERDEELSAVFDNMPWLSDIKIKTLIVPYYNPKFDSSKHQIDSFSTELKNLYIATRFNILYIDELNKQQSIAFYTTEAIIDDLISHLLSAKIEIVQARNAVDKLK